MDFKKLRGTQSPSHASPQKNWLLPPITVSLSESDNDVLGGSRRAGDVSGV